MGLELDRWVSKVRQCTADQLAGSIMGATGLLLVSFASPPSRGGHGFPPVAGAGWIYPTDYRWSLHLPNPYVEDTGQSGSHQGRLGAPPRWHRTLTPLCPAQLGEPTMDGWWSADYGKDELHQGW